MCINLICLTTKGGLPIFTRKKGNCNNLPFSTVASLNGFHMFFKSLDMTLQTTYSDGWTYLWQDFYDSITLIICAREVSEVGLQQLAEIVFSAFSLFVSREDLQHPLLMERMKKEAKNYMSIVDEALNSQCFQLLGYTECHLMVDNGTLLQKLNEFSTQCGSLFCCLIISGRVAVATEGWWDLSSLERTLLHLLLISSTGSKKDIPVYLPKKSPNIAYRFVSIEITPNAVICLLCGLETSSYHDLVVTGQNKFSNELINANASIERHLFNDFMDRMFIDEHILRVVITNELTNKYVARNMPRLAIAGPDNRVGNEAYHMELLFKFVDCSLQNMCDMKKNQNGFSNPTGTTVKSQFWCLDYYKCYMQSDDQGNTIFILFKSSMPKTAMPFIADKLLEMIRLENSICWL